jgi:hypothetical protein
MRAIASSLVVVLFSVCLAAADPPATTSQAPAPPSATPPVSTTSAPATPANPVVDTSKAPPLRVVGFALPPTTATTVPEQKKEAARQNARRASLGESVIIKTDPTQLRAYLDFAAKQKKEVTLYLNGKDTLVVPEAIDYANGLLQFPLQRNSDNKAVWTPLLRGPFEHQTRIVESSVAISGTPAVDATNSNFTLVVVKWAWYAWLWLLLLVIVLIVFFWLAKKFCILCDAPNGPYSLGRCQMAWWFFLIIIAYVLIWLISGDRDTITASLLTLMGISAGTALGAVMIDSTNAGVPAGAAAPVPVSHGFLRDILGDSGGNIGLHRFQIVVWTLVLGIMFSVSVITELTMPEFSSTLLAAMGISAGTYLGFKFPEK